MTENKDLCKDNYQERKMVYRHGASNAVYGLGFVGALVYFLQHATTLWMGVLGILKAIVWPAVIVYKWLEFFKM